MTLGMSIPFIPLFLLSHLISMLLTCESSRQTLIGGVEGMSIPFIRPLLLPNMISKLLLVDISHHIDETLMGVSLQGHGVFSFLPLFLSSVYHYWANSVRGERANMQSGWARKTIWA